MQRRDREKNERNVHSPLRLPILSMLFVESDRCVQFLSVDKAGPSIFSIGGRTPYNLMTSSSVGFIPSFSTNWVRTSLIFDCEQLIEKKSQFSIILERKITWKKKHQKSTFIPFVVEATGSWFFFVFSCAFMRIDAQQKLAGSGWSIAWNWSKTKTNQTFFIFTYY